MTLTQLGAFVLVARLGTVKAAATALGVTEPAVSQALAALRQHLGDPLLVRAANGMTLTPGGNRLLPIASQMVALGAEAEAAVRAARGAPEQLRVVATSSLAEFVATPLLDAFARRAAGSIDTSSGVAAATEMPVLVGNRLADLALGPDLSRPGLHPGADLVSEPIFRYRLVVVGSGRSRPAGGPAGWSWLVDPSGTDPGSDTGELLRRLRVPDSRVRVFPNQTAAWAAAAGGAGVAPAIAHLAAPQLRRGELAIVEVPATPVEGCWYVSTLSRDRRPVVAGSLRHFLGTPEAMQLMRSPGTGLPPSRFRPPVYVTIWS
ncbi:MAG TPA: LysR family transcriptional regulator [Mycobacteriales bacterium]|nr:LysR family transcriptional regulator [Mycobacteriales bacterium]